jgi:glycosyltransferase involved in cell wall biosynthesis
VSEHDLSFCVLLAGPVSHDGRVQRTVRTLSGLGRVLLVTVGGSEGDQELFDERVEVFSAPQPRLSGPRRWFLLHRQHDQLADVALADGRGFDLVWSNDYPTLWPAVRIARATGAKLVYDSHELWLDTVNQFFPADARLPRRLAFKLIVAVCRAIGGREEPKLARHADAVLTVNESVAAVLSKRLHRPEIGVVLNCPERDGLRPSERISTALGLPAGARIVLYQGNMNPGRGLPELVASARDFPDGVRLVLLGGGVLEASLRRAVKDAGLERRVSLAGFVPKAELHDWTQSADIGVLILEPLNLSKRLALANKIFEYMAAGIPILATDLPENRRIITECDCGWLITDSSPAELARHISRILAQPEEIRRRGENGRRWVEKRYCWEIESGEVVAVIDRLTPRTASPLRGARG